MTVVGVVTREGVSGGSHGEDLAHAENVAVERNHGV